MRIASLRFHAVIPDEECTLELLHNRGGYWRDLWGWVSVSATAKACLLGLVAPYEDFPRGTHETFFIVANTTVQQTDSLALLKTKFPEITDLRIDFAGSNVGFMSTEKAKRMLGWQEEGFLWKA